ncbi:hypothetical protein KKD70_01625 [Patescibacteria group bacterium]|nr:hypothetical protein [Patescibacteria group bacterium]
MVENIENNRDIHSGMFRIEENRTRKITAELTAIVDNTKAIIKKSTNTLPSEDSLHETDPHTEPNWGIRVGKILKTIAEEREYHEQEIAEEIAKITGNLNPNI